MKTPIQEYIQKLKARRLLIEESYRPLSHLKYVKDLRNMIIEQINQHIYLAVSMLKEEKEHIVNAYKEGCSDSILDESTDEERAKEYYNETYGKE
jgi:hypothetical protein